MIITPPISMLKITNSSENLLTLMDMVEKDGMVDRSVSNGIIKNLLKS